MPCVCKIVLFVLWELCWTVIVREGDGDHFMQVHGPVAGGGLLTLVFCAVANCFYISVG